jgi:hypothetical protein
MTKNQKRQFELNYSVTKAFAISLTKEITNKLNLWVDSGTYTERLLRVSLLDFVCRMQDDSCLLNATKLYETIPNGYFTSPTNPNNINK